jgi:hypothetical protein
MPPTMVPVNLLQGAAAWKFTPKFGIKKQGADGITTPAPYVAGQWGRGDDRLPG